MLASLLSSVLARREGSRWLDPEARVGSGGMDYFLRYGGHSGQFGTPITINQIHSALDHPGDRRAAIPAAASKSYSALGRSDPARARQE